MNKGQLKSYTHLNILNKDITVATNSRLLKKFIEGGFTYSHSNKKSRKSSRVNYFLKKPEDVCEVLASTLNFAKFILKDIQERYLLFHASAFSQNNQATIILGDGGSGKSSLCFAGGLEGAKIISDEPVLINKSEYSVIPFRYLIKIDHFYDIFSTWKFSSNFDIRQNRFIEKLTLENLDFSLFVKRDLKNLGIAIEDKKMPLKNIIFLEKKKCDPVIHLFKHHLNKSGKINADLNYLNNLIKGKEIKFFPDIMPQIKNRKSAKRLLNKIIYD